ncbi:MAG TPA: hypothetical protein VG871_18675 [Vicinamibacterales bacterium]|nr:hypothetical protein [Vicinamibacterales bacterium]
MDQVNLFRTAAAAVRRVWVDLVIVCALWAAACAAGVWYVGVYSAARAPVDLSYREFAAAVSMACGRGFVDPGYDATPGLDRFLSAQTDTFSCSEFPPRLDTAPPNFTQRIYRYLMESAALVWIVRGRISWSGLTPLYGMLYAFTIAAAYGIFRTAMRLRLLAVLAAVAFMVSAIHLAQLPFIRDYAKAPFILGLLLVMARMAVGPLTWRRTLALAAAFGVILGIGFGFRNDLLINVPPFVAVVFLCLPGRIIRNLAMKCAAVGVAAALFVAVSWPVLRAYERGSNSGHVALLGLMTTFERPLGIRGSIYDWGYTYLDGFISATIYSYNYRIHGITTEFLSKDYDRAAMAYLFQVARHWPADMMARAYASVLKVLELPFTIGTYTNVIPYGATGPRVSAFYGWQIGELRHLSGYGVLLAALALAFVAGTSIWSAFALLGLLMYYAGYPAIQFQVRHFFHLEFIGWLALGFVVDRVAMAAWTLGQEWRSRRAVDLRPWTRGALRAGAFAASAAAVIAGGLVALRAYQQPHVRALLETYAAAPRERLATQTIVKGDTALIVSPELWADRLREEKTVSVSTQYLVAEFSDDACGAARLPVTLKYAWTMIANDFSREAVVALGRHTGPTRMFFPAFYHGFTHFAGLELPREYAGCLTSLSRVADVRRFPILLDITFTPTWRQAALYQTIDLVESRDDGGEPGYFTTPRTLVVSAEALDRPAPFAPADVVERASIVTRTPDGRWVIRGRPPLQTSYLLRFRAHQARRGDLFVAKGTTRTGSFLIGPLEGEQWSGNVAVDRRGAFVVAVQPTEDGEYGVLLSADLKPHFPADHIGHRIGPWVEWIPGATLWIDIVLDRIGWASHSNK